MYCNAVRRVVLPPDFATPALRYEAQTTDWSAQGYSADLDHDARTILLAIKYARAKCPHLRSVEWPCQGVSIDLDGKDDLGTIKLRQSHSLISGDAHGGTWQQTINLPDPLLDLTNFARDTASSDNGIWPSTLLAGGPIESTPFTSLAVPVRSIVFHKTDDYNFIINLPRLIREQAAGERLHTLTFLQINVSSSFAFPTLRRVLAAFSHAPIETFELRCGRWPIIIGLRAVDLAATARTISEYFPHLRHLVIGLHLENRSLGRTVTESDMAGMEGVREIPRDGSRSPGWQTR